MPMFCRHDTAAAIDARCRRQWTAYKERPAKSEWQVVRFGLDWLFQTIGQAPCFVAPSLHLPRAMPARVSTGERERERAKGVLGRNIANLWRSIKM